MGGGMTATTRIRAWTNTCLPPAARMRLYGLFQEEVTKDLPYIYICYLDFIYVTSARVHGITPNRLLGYGGVGFFWNVNEWTVE